MHKKLIVVVEDDDGIRLLLSELLTARGYEVLQLADGSQVAQQVALQSPAAVVLDVGLPGKHGLSVLDELKRDPATGNVPVVVCSAWCDGDLVGRAMAAGASDYVKKPFSGAELLERVDAAVAEGASHRMVALADDVRKVMVEDRLTGLPNRIGLEERLTGALDFLDPAEDLGLVMIRIDRYDDISKWGDAGANDLLVRMLASELGRRTRPGDVLGRWDADTFLVIAARADLAATGRLAEIMRGAAGPVRARAGWTVSAGYASTAECEPDELLACCDAAIAAAAGAGGDLSRAGLPAGRLRVA